MKARSLDRCIGERTGQQPGPAQRGHVRRRRQFRVMTARHIGRHLKRRVRRRVDVLPQRTSLADSRRMSMHRQPGTVEISARKNEQEPVMDRFHRAHIPSFHTLELETSRSQPMLAKRSGSIIQDDALRLQVSRIGIEPGIHMLGPDRDDAAVVPGCGNFGRRLVCDRRKEQQVRLIRRRPPRPKTSDQHVLRRLGYELKHKVFGCFIGPKGSRPSARCRFTFS